MALVVRVKRRFNEEPLEALVISCKKRKTNVESSDESITAVFKFAGTVVNQDESISANLSQLLEKQGVKDISKPASDVRKKSRQQAKLQSEQSRYKLVNYFRSLDDSQVSVEGETDDKGTEVTVLDVEAQPKNTPSQSTSSKTDVQGDLSKTETEFVYDLYHKEVDNNVVDVDDLLLDGIVSVNPLDAELVFESYRGHRAQDANSDSEDNFEDEDSNDENNWRNDYPDEDELNSDDADSLAGGMERVMIGKEDLSSDEEPDIYDEKLTTCELRYGSSYAKYKKRVCEEFGEGDSDDSSDDSSNDSSRSSVSDLSGIDIDE